MKARIAIAAILIVMAGAAQVQAAPGVAARPDAPSLLAAATPITPNGAWTTYHHDNAHTGFDSTQPAAAGATAGWVSPTLDGQVYGEPLVFNGLVYVGTLAGTVYALDQSTGLIAWSKNVGAPQSKPSNQCGNVSPLGILGTPVIDATAGRIYVSELRASDTLWHVYGIDLTSHAIVVDDPIPNTIGTGFDWTIEQQRGALALSKDRSQVYVPFGGRAGDCGPYHGWVVGVPTSGTGTPNIYESPSTAEGVWAGGGVVVDDATGNVLFATGNAIPCSGAVNSDSVIRTSASLGPAVDFFQPQDWSSNWCGPDWDLGSASPTLISPTLAFMSGKYGQGFLVDPTNLGHTNGQLFPAKTPYVGADVCVGNNADATFGSFAYAAPRIYLECDNHGIVSLTVNTAAKTFSLCDSSCAAAGTWQAGGSTTFGPPIVAGGVVWAVDIGGSGLYGFNATTGAPVYHSGAFGVNHFSTPSEAGGQIFVSAGTVVRSFNMGFSCKAVGVSASPPSPAPVGTSVAITGSATGCPNISPSYEFWVLAPGSSTWQLARGYSTSATYNWTTSGKAAGSYRFSVWAKDASSSGAHTNSLGSYDAFNAGQFYTLTSTACTSVAVSASPPSPDMVGTAVTITGLASGCPNATYQFWILAPSSSTWQLARAYGASATFGWTTTGKAPGTYRFSVWVKDASSSGVHTNSLGRYDAFNAGQFFTLTPGCSAVGISASGPSPAAAGPPVTFTASASGCLNPAPVYQFWILSPGSSTWQIAQPYGTSATFNWTTMGKPAGTYRFSVWVKDSSSPGAYINSLGRYDVFNAGQFFRLT